MRRGPGSFLVPVSPRSPLNPTRHVVTSEVSNAGVLTFLRNVKLAEAITATTASFERLDVLVANACVIYTVKLAGDETNNTIN
jgi:hypothetical protein